MGNKLFHHSSKKQENKSKNVSEKIVKKISKKENKKFYNLAKRKEIKEYQEKSEVDPMILL